MKVISDALFGELRRLTSNIAMGWLLTRADGFQLGFTSHDEEFVYDGITYSPSNAFSGTAAVAKNNLSVDNMSAVALFSDLITEKDIRGGRWDNAGVKVFWINPDRPEWGVVPIRGGSLGEIKLRAGQFETELRSIVQKLQQPFGDYFTLECSYKLGDSRCKVVMDPSVWAASHQYTAAYVGEASVGAVVKPSVYNGFWYRALHGNTDSSIAWGFTKQYGRTGAYSDPVHGTLAPPFNPGSVQKQTVTLPVKVGVTGGTEPTWPTTLGATVSDGGITWEAIHARVKLGTVSVSYGASKFHDTGRNEPTNFFKYGSLTWLTGDNAGFKSEIIDDTGHAFVLLDVMPELIQVGDTYSVTQGCPKTRPACINQPAAGGFANIHNYGGFPDMPTEDKALQSPNVASPVPSSEDSGGKG